jgi:hypothetical protein
LESEVNNFSIRANVLRISEVLTRVPEAEGEGMMNTRIGFVFLAVCGLVAPGSVSAQQKHASRAGWISDESCGTQHTKPGRADCVQKCWRGGAPVGHPEWKPQRAVFVADDDQAIWIVENPEAARNFPAAHVVLEGKFDSAKKTIHIEKISPLRNKAVQNTRQNPDISGNPDMSGNGCRLRRSTQHHLIS